MEPAAEGLFTAAGVKRRRPQADGMKRPGAATHLFTAGGVKRHRPQADGAQPLAWEKRLLCGHLCDAARLEKEIRAAYNHGHATQDWDVSARQPAYMQVQRSRACVAAVPSCRASCDPGAPRAA